MWVSLAFLGLISATPASGSLHASFTSLTSDISSTDFLCSSGLCSKFLFSCAFSWMPHLEPQPSPSLCSSLAFQKSPVFFSYSLCITFRPCSLFLSLTGTHSLDAAFHVSGCLPSRGSVSLCCTWDRPTSLFTEDAGAQRPSQSFVQQMRDSSSC